MASFETLQQLAAHPEWIRPRSDVRVFLGEPGAPEATKTTVEPGNVFSPGMKTFGVTWWLRFPATGRFFATETAPLEALEWRYEQGFLPLLLCEADASGVRVRHSLFQDGTWQARSEAVCGCIQLHAQAEPVRVELFLALRSLGPAGGPLPALEVGADDMGFVMPSLGLPLLVADRVPEAIGCGVGDPSSLARDGQVPGERSVHDAAGWCFGLMRFDLLLQPGSAWAIRFECPHQTQGSLANELPSTVVPAPAQFAERAANHLGRWRERLGTLGLEVPDAHFRNAFFAGLQHMLTATVGDQARIAPLAYPLPWLRDSVFIIRCFDLAGQHALARAATEYCARNDFFGGFGAEGDAPGQGIWALVQHYRVTGDRAWLAALYPSIQRKCDWLFRMRRATAPIQLTTDTPTLPFTHAERAMGVVCLAARDGVIMGAMDHGVGYAVGWVNHWALCGLREAAYAARALSDERRATQYEAEAAELQAALEGWIGRGEAFFEHERTVNSLLWPTRAWTHAPELVRPGFDAWWWQHRGDGEHYRPEPYWLYFEFAQAHNALLLGQPQRAWQTLDYRLRHQDLPGLYGWREGGHGVGTENAVDGPTLLHQLRGCQRLESITPHGWSQAEAWLLQRAMLVEEWGDGVLLFAGIPRAWLAPGARIAFRDFPTWYGRLSATLTVDDAGDTATLRVDGAPNATRIVRLGGAETRLQADEIRLRL